MSEQTTTGGRLGKVIGNVLKFLVRLTWVLLMGILLGGGLYLGVPWVYHALISPVQDAQARVFALEQRFDREQTQRTADLTALQERVTRLEVENTTLRESLATQTEASNAVAARLQPLERRATAAEGQLAEQKTALEALRTRLNTALTASTERDQAVETLLGALQARLAGLQGEQVLLQAAQEVLKVQLLLLEDNPRAARATLALVGERLELAAQLQPARAVELLALQERVTALDALLVTNSPRVGPELEALWAALDALLMPAVPLPVPQPLLSPLTPPPPPPPAP